MTAECPLYAYFGQLKASLLKVSIEKREEAVERLSIQLDQIQQKIEQLRLKESDLRHSVDDQGGRRLADIDKEIDRLVQERIRKQQNAESYQQFCQQLAFQVEISENQFYNNKKLLVIRTQSMQKEKEALDHQHTDCELEKRAYQQHFAELENELKSLRSRETNIPAHNLVIRQQLCETLGIAAQQLPFIGELIQVRAKENHWSGAVERVLHNFGLSLLVPETLYHQVSYYVEKTHLKGRLVYYKVINPRASFNEQMAKGALINKLEIKPDTCFYAWLEQQLNLRFDYICCESMDQFHRTPKAISLQGQIKSNAQRHEKDDRFALNDRSRFILGWSNQDKIQALLTQQKSVSEKGQQCVQKLMMLAKQKTALEVAYKTIYLLENIKQFDEIHWQPLARNIEVLETEKRQIEQDSDILRQLQQQLTQTQFAIKAQDDKYREKNQAYGRQFDHLEMDKKARNEAITLVNNTPLEQRQQRFPKLNALRGEVIVNKVLTVANCDDAQKVLREHIQNRLDNESRKLVLVRDRIIRQMQQYRNDYPIETREIDADIESLNEYLNMLEKLKHEDLPRHEKRFKQMLNEGAIQDIALLQNQLEKERAEIETKIDKINQSLQSIDYDPVQGTYIKLVSDRSQDAEIRQFQQDLRNCLGDALAVEQDDLYTEQKFLQVKKIIDKFNGRDGYTDIDKRWTRKVTDVRNWFLFSASERWREDHKEKEHYSDAAGKSGGQKEKLAYTILASALAAFPDEKHLAIKNVMSRYAMDIINCEPDWQGILKVIQYFQHHPRPQCYLRALSIPNIDSKFIEQHKKIINDFLLAVLPENQYNHHTKGIAQQNFEQRFYLKYETPLIRFRILDPALSIQGLHDITLPLEQFNDLLDHDNTFQPRNIFITENKANGLAFPAYQNAIVIFGLGYGIQSLFDTKCLHQVNLYYWGDIDTHGFNILNQWRKYFPHSQSFLMNKAILMASKKQWVVESQPIAHELKYLTAEEQEVYQGLIKHQWGRNLRLEQERVAYDLLKQVLNLIASGF